MSGNATLYRALEAIADEIDTRLQFGVIHPIPGTTLDDVKRCAESVSLLADCYRALYRVASGDVAASMVKLRAEVDRRASLAAAAAAAAPEESDG